MCDSDSGEDDIESYFLRPVNEYVMAEKIELANKELFESSHAGSPEAFERKVTFSKILVDYSDGQDNISIFSCDSNEISLKIESSTTEKYQEKNINSESDNILEVDIDDKETIILNSLEEVDIHECEEIVENEFINHNEVPTIKNGGKFLFRLKKKQKKNLDDEDNKIILINGKNNEDSGEVNEKLKKYVKFFSHRPKNAQKNSQSTEAIENIEPNKQTISKWLKVKIKSSTN